MLLPIGRVTVLSGIIVLFSLRWNVIQKLRMEALAVLRENLASRSLHWLDWRLCWKPMHLKLTISLQNLAH